MVALAPGAEALLPFKGGIIWHHFDSFTPSAGFAGGPFWGCFEAFRGHFGAK